MRRATTLHHDDFKRAFVTPFKEWWSTAILPEARAKEKISATYVLSRRVTDIEMSQMCAWFKLLGWRVKRTKRNASRYDTLEITTFPNSDRVCVEIRRCVYF